MVCAVVPPQKKIGQTAAPRLAKRHHTAIVCLAVCAACKQLLRGKALAPHLFFARRRRGVGDRQHQQVLRKL